MPHADDDDADVRTPAPCTVIAYTARSRTRAMSQEDATGHPYRTPRQRVDDDTRQTTRRADIGKGAETNETPNAR